MGPHDRRSLVENGLTDVGGKLTKVPGISQGVSIFSDYRKFLDRGNVIDLAVAVVIGKPIFFSCLLFCYFDSSIDVLCPSRLTIKRKDRALVICFCTLWGTKFLWAYVLSWDNPKLTHSSHPFGIHIKPLNDNRCRFHFCKSGSNCLGDWSHLLVIRLYYANTFSSSNTKLLIS